MKYLMSALTSLAVCMAMTMGLASPASAAVFTERGKKCEMASGPETWAEVCAWVNIDTTNHVFRAYVSVDDGQFKGYVRAVRNGVVGSAEAVSANGGTASTGVYPCASNAINYLKARVKAKRQPDDGLSFDAAAFDSIEVAVVC